MKSIINTDIEPSCAVCVYAEETQDEKMYCTKKKRHYPSDNKCRRFSLDITIISVRRKRLPKYINHKDFSID